MPAVLERLIQKIKPDKWDALDEIDKRFDEVESKYKFPPKRRYRSMVGPLDDNIIVIEREWKSMAKYEDALLNSYGNPEEQALAAELADIMVQEWREVYLVWPLKV